MSNVALIIEANHFLRDQLKGPNFKWLDPEDEDLTTDLIPDLPAKSIVLDLSVASSDEKRSLYELLSDLGHHVYADLSTVWGDAFIEEFRCLKGALATCYPSPKKTYEAWARTPKDQAQLQELLGSAFNLKFVARPGLGFTFPRVLAQLVNEAYFSLEDQLASENDIDQAMRFGVSYPLGPFEWSAHEVSTRGTLHLLDELFAVTGEPRYRASLALRRAFLKRNT